MPGAVEFLNRVFQQPARALDPQDIERGELLIALLVCGSIDTGAVRPSPSMKVRCQSSSISRSQRCSA
jgi:hypothetical protein